MTSPVLGRFYEFRNPETHTSTIGKALSIEGDVVNYLVFYKSVEYFGKAAKPHHTTFELIMTDEQSKEFVANVQREIKVLRVNEFRKRVFEDPFLLE